MISGFAAYFKRIGLIHRGEKRTLDPAPDIEKQTPNTEH